MNWKRIGRTVICLLVVCCLIVNISPLKADAVALEAAVIGVTATIVIAGILVGLGVMPGVDTTAFDGIVDSCKDYLTSVGYVANGLMSVYALTNANYKYAVDWNLIEKVREWLFAEEVLTETVVDDGYAYYNGVLLPVLPALDLSSYPYRLIVFNQYSDIYYLIFSPSQPVYSSSRISFSGSRAMIYTISSGRWQFSSYESNSMGFGCSSVIWANHNISSGDFGLSASDPVSPSGVSSSVDVSLGEVASSDTAIADGYITWADNAVLVPGSLTGSDEESISAWPIGLNNSYADTSQMTQADIWNGVSDYGAQTPVLSVDLGTDSVTYEQHALASPLVVSASVSDGGHLSYSWYVSANGADEKLVEGAISSTFIPLTDVIGTYVYRCHVTNLVVPYSIADVWSKAATIEVVASGSIAVPDSDAVTHTGLQGLLGVLVSNISAAFDNAIGKVISWGNNLQMAISNFFDSAVTGVLEGIKAIFVPSEDFLTAKVNALRARFGFANSIMDTGQAIGAALTDFETSPPIIYMELGNAESKYDWGDRAIALDLRWYERYKPTVDVLLSALLWIFFAWRVFRKLPDIISGVAGDTPESNVSDGRFILTHYASDSRRLTSGSLTRRK